MVTEETEESKSTTVENSVEEAKVSKKPKAKKSKYDFIDSGAVSDMRVHIVRIKETADDGNREWKEYTVVAANEKAALKLVGPSNYDPFTVSDGGSYEE